MSRYENSTAASVLAGRFIRAAREKLSLTRAQVCKESGVSLSTLARLENGYQAAPTIDVLGRVLLALRHGEVLMDEGQDKVTTAFHRHRTNQVLEDVVLRLLAGLDPDSSQTWALVRSAAEEIDSRK